MASSGAVSLLAENPRITELKIPKKFSANDQINLGVIGMGIMGNNNTRTALKVPGVKLVAVCDLYKGRLTSTHEKYGSEIAVTQNYQELLARPDIDAVVIATSDHWHQRLSIAAMEAGKAVYCEKPVVQKFEEGAALMETQKEPGR